jgi:hypothetical protein
MSAYREGLNSANAFYQLLCFYKVVEWIRKRRAKEDRRRVPPESERFPSSAEGLPPDAFGRRDPFGFFTPYLGKRFGEVHETLRSDVRNAIAHLNPKQTILMADRFDDVARCERVVPVVRFMARRMLLNEIGADWRSQSEPA